MRNVFLVICVAFPGVACCDTEAGLTDVISQGTADTSLRVAASHPHQAPGSRPTHTKVASNHLPASRLTATPTPPGKNEKKKKKGTKLPEALPMSYRPAVKQGPYQVEGACEYRIDPSWAEFTMRPDESLAAFMKRANAARPKGLVVNIPTAALEGKVCEKARLGKKKKWPEHLIVRGIPNEKGDLPRFYCRSKRKDGNVPNKKVQSTPLAVSGTKTTVYDSIHIDGYKRLINIDASTERAVIKSSYLHHAMEDGILWSNQKKPGSKLSVEICGSEIAHSGKGNVKHNIYGHRGLNGSTVELTIVDSLFHSPASSSNIKSIANTNVIVGNRIFSQLDTDPSFKRRWASMNIDIASCAQNRIDNNEIVYWRRHNIGKYNIGIRNRAKVVQGCDVPPYGSKRFMDPEYWKTTKDSFITTIRNNVLRAEPENTHGLRSTPEEVFAIRSWGTWPQDAVTLGEQGLLEPPTDEQGRLIWRERHKVLTEGNRYIGFDRAKIYSSISVGHCDAARKGCWKQPAIKPSDYYGKLDTDGINGGYSYFSIGPGEVVSH